MVNVKEKLKANKKFEKTGIEYIRQGDYYILKITILRARRTGNIGKYERLKLYIYKIQRSRICDL